MRNPLIVALDLPTVEQALEIARKVAPVVGALKIGSELFTLGGPEIVRTMKSFGAGIFLDLKFHDIPNTVSKAVTVATRLGVDMLTIHTSGGSAMMQAAEESAQKTASQAGLSQAPLVLGVTVLTSMDGNSLGELGLETNVGKQVERLATLAMKSGLRGLVCSPLEVTALRQFLPTQFQLVTPGIRPANSPADDQKRTLTPREALAAGSSWLVVGRPVYGDSDPRKAAESMLNSL